MRSLRRKIAGSLLADLLETPTEQAWIELSNSLRGSEGTSVYDRELVPGFEGTLGSELLWRPHREEAEEAIQNKNEDRRTKKLLATLSKIGRDLNSTSWEYEAGGRQPYTDVYSQRRERDNDTGVDIAWHQTGESFYNPSTSPEPPFLNQDNYNTGTPDRYQQ